MYYWSGTNLFNNLGTLQKTSPDPNDPTTATIGVQFNNSGSVEVLNGTLQFTSTFTQTDGITLLDGGTLVSTNQPLNLNGGILGGVGLVNARVNNQAGTVRPGVASRAIGTLQINGNYTQGANGVLHVELSANGHDQLLIEGDNRTVSLNGVLRVGVLNHFVPRPGTRYEILRLTGSGGSIQGRFSRVEVDRQSPPRFKFTVEYSSRSVAIVVRGVEIGPPLQFVEPVEPPRRR